MVDFCGIMKHSTNSFFFSFLNMFCRNQITITNYTIHNSLLHYCDNFKFSSFQVSPEEALRSLCSYNLAEHLELKLYGIRSLVEIISNNSVHRKEQRKRFLIDYQKQISDKTINNNVHITPIDEYKKNRMKNERNARSISFGKSGRHPYNAKTVQERNVEIKRYALNFSTNKKMSEGFGSSLVSKDTIIQQILRDTGKLKIKELLSLNLSPLHEKNKDLLRLTKNVYDLVAKEQKNDPNNPLRMFFSQTIDKRYYLPQGDSCSRSRDNLFPRDTNSTLLSPAQIFNCTLVDNFILYLQYEFSIINYYFGVCFPLYRDYFKRNFDTDFDLQAPVCQWPRGLVDKENPYSVNITISKYIDNWIRVRRSPKRNTTIEVFNNNTFSRISRKIIDSSIDFLISGVAMVYESLPSDSSIPVTPFIEDDTDPKDHRDFLWYLKHFLVCENRGGNFCATGGVGLKKGLLSTLIIYIFYKIITRYLLEIEITIPYFFYILLVIVWMFAYLYSPACFGQIPTCFMIDVQNLIEQYILPPSINWGCFIQNDNFKELSSFQGAINNDFNRQNCSTILFQLPQCAPNYTLALQENQINSDLIEYCYDMKRLALDQSHQYQCPLPEELLLGDSKAENQKYQLNLQKFIPLEKPVNTTIFVVCHIEFQLVDPIDSLILGSRILFGKDYPIKFLTLDIPLVYEFFQIDFIREKVERYKNPKYNSCSAEYCFYYTSFLLIPIVLLLLAIISFTSLFLVPYIFNFLLALYPIVSNYKLILTNIIFELFYRSKLGQY